jgi:hypothetical protein
MPLLSRMPGDFLYLDESGDLGLGRDSSPFFVVGILHLDSEDALRRVIKRARKRALGRARKNEMKWSSSSSSVREAVIEQIVRESSHIAGVSACAIEKSWINPSHAQRKPDVRYNFAAKIALEQGMLFDAGRPPKSLTLTLDARNRRATESMSEYLDLLERNGELCCRVKVRAEGSAKIPQLQIADFVVGSLYEAVAYGRWNAVRKLEQAGIVVNLRILRGKKMLAP